MLPPLGGLVLGVPELLRQLSHSPPLAATRGSRPSAGRQRLVAVLDQVPVELEVLSEAGLANLREASHLLSDLAEDVLARRRVALAAAS